MNIPKPLKTYQANDTLLNGHIILITGAGDGIGAAVAKDSAAKGATVILLGKTVKKLEIAPAFLYLLGADSEDVRGQQLNAQ